MSEELLEVLTPEGVPTGLSVPRREIHATGQWHLSVRIWIVSGCQILLQKRAENKESYPGLYDTAAAGHVSSGESCDHAALREIQEELGLEIPAKDLRPVTVRRLCMEDKSTGFISNEFNHLYLVRVRREDCLLQLQQEEVSGAKWMDLQDLLDDLTNAPEQYCIDPDEISVIAPLITPI